MADSDVFGINKRMDRKTWYKIHSHVIRQRDEFISLLENITKMVNPKSSLPDSITNQIVIIIGNYLNLLNKKALKETKKTYKPPKIKGLLTDGYKDK